MAARLRENGGWEEPHIPGLERLADGIAVDRYRDLCYEADAANLEPDNDLRCCFI